MCRVAVAVAVAAVAPVMANMYFVRLSSLVICNDHRLLLRYLCENYFVCDLIMKVKVLARLTCKCRPLYSHVSILSKQVQM